MQENVIPCQNNYTKKSVWR